jgi:predicted transcriptional regulator
MLGHESPVCEEAALSRIQQVIDTLEAERAEVQERLAWLDRQINEFEAHNGSTATVAPARSVRRSTSRRASTRRAAARSRQGDIKASIIEFLAKHPGSTAGDIAKALNLNPGSVSTRLTQLAKTGQIQKASRGYSVK